MSYTDLIYAIGDLITESFAILRLLGSGPYGMFNWVIISVGVIMAIWWMGQMKKYDREAEENGTLR